MVGEKFAGRAGGPPAPRLSARQRLSPPAQIGPAAARKISGRADSRAALLMTFTKTRRPNPVTQSR
jgi:hypothetical protein